MNFFNFNLPDSLSFTATPLERVLRGTQRSTSAPGPCPVRDGKQLRRNMRWEFATKEELNAMIRPEGVEASASDNRMYLEAVGETNQIRQERPRAAA